jgi:formamidopyrimidine-DNA glycosylase
MPELPDITIYIEALERRIVGQRLVSLRIGSPFVLRTVEPAASDLAGKRVVGLRRLGKRIVIELEESLFIVIHLMVAGRLKWSGAAAAPAADRTASSPTASPARPASTRPGGKAGLATLTFENGTLLMTEAGSKRRASIHLLRGESAVRAMDPGGLEVFDATLDEFRAALTRERHTVKRTLTDPHVFSGIGNAYSDEILHRARLSPVQMTTNLAPAEIERLWRITVDTLRDWTERLRRETGEGFPAKVTAFRPDMAVHGKYGEPCPDCDTPVQRIVYADNETNYCARCQTGGKLLADRALSRLLKGDWPKSIDDIE